MSKTLGSRVREIRESLGWSQAELARKSNLSDQYISKIELSKVTNIGIETIEQIAKSLNVHSSYLLYGQKEWDVFKTKIDEKRYSYKGPEMGFYGHFVEIPVLTGSVSAGEFSQDLGEWEGETIVVPTEPKHGRTLVAWKIRGRSMEPHYRDGDFILIDKELSPVNGDSVIALKDGDEITIKEFRLFENGDVELRPINPEFKTFQFPKGEGLNILGVVFGMVRYEKAWRKKKR